tara:strand:+ start:726 stop:1001 length:276 start_codon:yes stop_codon:yes gene_type:complete
MTETKKFTKEELDQITALRDSNTTKIGEFGQLELEILLTSQRLETLSKAKETLHEDYIKLQEQERDLVQSLNERYGAGTVDITNGEFTPAN